MAITVRTGNPFGLLAALRKAIDDKHIQTWSYDAQGDFTHTPAQWSGKAWLRPSVGAGTLVFGLLGQKNVVMKKSVYGVYHGRFIEELLTHFDHRFSTAVATADQQPRIDVFETVS